MLKKCKTVDVPAVDAAFGNIQRALQKYVSFEGIDAKFCEDLYNKTEVHSINTSKGEAADVGIFSDKSQTTVFEFLEAAELAYLGRGNSVQKANRLYNKHFYEEIKSHVINISDNYNLMKTWLINTYGGPSRIVGDTISNLSRKPKPVRGNRKDKFVFYSAITGAIQRLEKLSRANYIN